MSDQAEDQSSRGVPDRRVVLQYQGGRATRAVTVQTFYDPLEAQLFANELASHHIECFLLNQNVSVLGPYSGFSQVELQVREQDVVDARRVLTEFQADPSKEETDASSDPADDGEPRCPQCGSYRVTEASRPWPGLLKFFFGASDTSGPEMECLRCHHRWRL